MDRPIDSLKKIREHSLYVGDKQVNLLLGKVRMQVRMRRLAQWLEHWSCKPGVVSSSLMVGRYFKNLFYTSLASYHIDVKFMKAARYPGYFSLIFLNPF